MASPTPFSFSGVLSLTEAPGLPADPIPINMSGQFTQRSGFVFSLTGSGTQSINFGALGSPGLKGLLIMLDAGSSVSPILIKINGSSTGGIEISSGGFHAVGSPSPTAGITAISIDYTSACTVRAWVLG